MQWEFRLYAKFPLHDDVRLKERLNSSSLIQLFTMRYVSKTVRN